MSDVSQGPGWWIASDGKWYPPQQHPDYRPPAPPQPPTQAAQPPPSAPIAPTVPVSPRPSVAPHVSDVSQGPGWWIASDGRWYPPERHPNHQPGARSVLVPASVMQSPGAEVPWTAPVQGVAQRVSTVPVHGPPARVVGKTRDPWRVWLLGLTIVYFFVWYFKVNKELRDFDHSINVYPGMSVAAVSIGVVLVGIPPVVSWAHTTSRIQRAQKLAGSGSRCSMLLSFVCLGFGNVYVQSQLNKVWDQFGNPPERTPIAA